MAETTNSSGQLRCYAAKAPQLGPSLIQNGHWHFQTHHLGWIISGVFTIIAGVASFWLINKHIQWYTNKKEQRFIVRILFMVPLYAVISFASYLFWNHSTPLILLRDCYESLVLTAFFYLLLTYISPNVEEQKEVFLKVGLSRENDRKRIRRGLKPQKWVLPLGFIKSKPADGLYFLQLMKWGVLQYCVIRPTTTLAAVILDYVGLYCEDSWSPGWGHIYLTVIMSLSVTVAMYCLLQLYVTIAEPLKPQKPLLKLFAIKAVVFLTFWQSTFLSLLAMLGVVKDTQYMTADNINIGIGAIAECIEMTMFAFLHIKCFSYKDYVPEPTTPWGDVSEGKTPRLRSLGHAMNFKETLREIWGGCVYIYKRMRGKETDKLVRRTVVMEGAFGRPRVAVRGMDKDLPPLNEKLDVNIEVEEMVHVGEERQWLGLGDNREYEFGHVPREKSEGLGEQIEKELVNLGYGTQDHEQGHAHGQRSWWRSIYDRISQSGPDESFTPAPKRKSWARPHISEKALTERTYDDPPPPSALRTYRSQQSLEKEAGGLVFHPLDLDWLAAPVTGSPARSDSLLARVFPYGPSASDLTHSVPSTEGPPTSSQSHRTQVRLGPNPTVVTTDWIPVKLAEIVETPIPQVASRAKPERSRSSHTRDGARYAPLLGTLRLTTTLVHPEFAKPSVARPSSTNHGNDSGHLSSPKFYPHSPTRTSPASFTKPHRPTKNQIKMPAPLALISELGRLPNYEGASPVVPPGNLDACSASRPYPQSPQPLQHGSSRNSRRKPPPSASISPVLPTRTHAPFDPARGVWTHSLMPDALSR